MPYTLKPNKIYARDNDGNSYLPQNVITDKTTAEDIELWRTATADIKADANAAVAAAQTAVDGIESQEQTMIARIASVAGQGTDTTLSQSGVAADAKAVGDLKAASSKIDDVEIAQFVKNYYINTSGSTVDINSPVASESQLMYAVFDCQEGDSFVVKGTGGNSGRLWCFISSSASNNVISKADSGAEMDYQTLVAPANAAKLVLNLRYQYESFVIKGNLVGKTIDEIKESISQMADIPDKIRAINLFEGTQFDPSNTISGVTVSDHYYSGIKITGTFSANLNINVSRGLISLDSSKTYTLYVTTPDTHPRLAFTIYGKKQGSSSSTIVQSGEEDVMTRDKNKAYTFKPDYNYSECCFNAWYSTTEELQLSKDKYFIILVEGKYTDEDFSLSSIPYVTPEMYGAIGDGATDDTNAIQNMLNAERKSIVFNSKKNYIISSPLYVHGGSNMPMIDLNNSIIRASGSFSGDYMIKVGDITETVENYDDVTRRKHGIINGLIDCLGKASGIYVVNATSAVFIGLNIVNCKLFGFKSDNTLINSMDSVVDNVNVSGIEGSTTDSTGFIINSYDSVYRALRTNHFRTGIHVTGNANSFMSVHPYYAPLSMNPSVYGYTVGIKCEGNHNIFIDPYCDNFVTGIFSSGCDNVYSDYFYFVYKKTLQEYRAIELDEAHGVYNRFNGIRFSWPIGTWELDGVEYTGVNGSILKTYPSNIYAPFNPLISNIMTSQEATLFTKTGFDYAYSTALNDQKQTVIRPFSSGSISANTKVPLFIVLNSRPYSFTITFGKKVYDCVFDPGDTGHVFQYTAQTSEVNDGELTYDRVRYKGDNNWLLVSFTPASSISNVTIELNSPGMIPFIGHIDATYTPLEVKESFDSYQLGKYSGFTEESGFTKQGYLYRYGGRDSIHCRLTIETSTLSYEQGETIVLGTWARFPQVFLQAFIYADNELKGIVPISYDNGKIEIEAPCSLTDGFIVSIVS